MPGTLFKLVSCVKAPSGDGVLVTWRANKTIARVHRKDDGTYQHLDETGHAIDLSEGIAVQREIMTAEYLAEYGMPS